MAKRVVLYDTVTGKYEPIVGTDNQALTWDSAGAGAWVSQAIPYDIAGAVAGSPTPAAEVFRFVAVRPCSIATTGNQAKAGTPSSGGTATFTIKKNGSGTDTLDFNNTATGVFTIASPITLAAGDVLTMEAGAVMYSIEDVGFTFFATVT